MSVRLIPARIDNSYDGHTLGLWLILNYLAGLLILQLIPLARSGTPPGPFVNLVLFVMVAGLALSLWKRGVGKGITSVSI